MKVVIELMAGLCILTQGQVYLKCNQCTTVSNKPATLYSVILLSRQPKQLKLSLLVLCIILLDIVSEPAYYLNEQAYPLQASIFP